MANWDILRIKLKLLNKFKLNHSKKNYVNYCKLNVKVIPVDKKNKKVAVFFGFFDVVIATKNIFEEQCW